MIKLVIDNTNRQPIQVTCRNSCDLFDYITESCSILEDINVDSIFETSKCSFFLMTNPNDNPSSFEEKADFQFDSPEIFHELIEKKILKESFTYSNEPDFPNSRDNAVWYISKCTTYGCWIVNNYKKPLPVPTSFEVAKKGWAKRVYKSPVPLHDHESPLSLTSIIAWIVDEEGYGQYALLINESIASVAFPKPSYWKE